MKNYSKDKVNILDKARLFLTVIMFDIQMIWMFFSILNTNSTFVTVNSFRFRLLLFDCYAIKDRM